MCEFEKHREQAKVRLEKNDEDYVPDFVDLLSQQDGKTIPDDEILENLMVRIWPNSSLCNQLQFVFLVFVNVVATGLATYAFLVLLMILRTI